MDRPDLELVLAVRQHGSLVMAARALRVAPSAVTKRLAALEAGLGLRLFQRTTRRVSPTAEGDALCERAVHLLRAFEEVEAELRERQTEPAGPVAKPPAGDPQVIMIIFQDNVLHRKRTPCVTCCVRRRVSSHC